MGIVMLPCADGTHASSIRTDRATPAGAARQRQPFEPAGAQRHLVCRRAWLQMARVTRTVWQLAHPLHPHESLVEERGARPGLRALAARTDRACQARSGVAGQHHRPGPSRRDGGAKKKTVPKPSADPAAVGPPRFIWLPRMLERPSPSRSPLDKPTTLQKGVSC